AVRPQLRHRGAGQPTGRAPRSATVLTQPASSLACITLPTPGRRPTGRGARNATTFRGGTTDRPSGLFWSEAILATNLLGATPAEAVSPVSARMSARIDSAIPVAEPNPLSGSLTSR